MESNLWIGDAQNARNEARLKEEERIDELRTQNSAPHSIESALVQRLDLYNIALEVEADFVLDDVNIDAAAGLDSLFAAAEMGISSSVEQRREVVDQAVAMQEVLDPQGTEGESNEIADEGYENPA